MTKLIVKPTEKDMQIHGKSSAWIADFIYKQLKEDYDEKLLGWVLTAYWYGPILVPMNIIDSSHREKWNALKRNKKIKKMAAAMQEGVNKPIILVNDPNNDHLKIIDGHTRFLARESISGVSIQSFIAEVSKVPGDWKLMHDLLKSGINGGNRE